MVIHIIFLRVFCSAEGPDPCELAQNPRYRKGPEVCFDNNENVRRSHTCAEIIAGSSSISQTSQLASIYFCLVSISVHTVGCPLLHSDPYLIYSFTSFFTYRFVNVFISLPLHALITQLFCFFLLSSCLLSSLHSSSAILVVLHPRRLLRSSGRMSPCVQSAEVLH